MSEQPPEVEPLAAVVAKLDQIIGLLEQIRDAGNSTVGLIALLDS